VVLRTAPQAAMVMPKPAARPCAGGHSHVSREDSPWGGTTAEMLLLMARPPPVMISQDGQAVHPEGGLRASRTHTHTHTHTHIGDTCREGVLCDAPLPLVWMTKTAAHPSAQLTGILGGSMVGGVRVELDNFRNGRGDLRVYGAVIGKDGVRVTQLRDPKAACTARVLLPKGLAGRGGQCPLPVRVVEFTTVDLRNPYGACEGTAADQRKQLKTTKDADTVCGGAVSPGILPVRRRWLVGGSR
jgi:hypothetical protein